ncbi:nucleoporin interacting component family protein [Striga asiatica]|uniref:Nucleoporin interacting component family protein n=1 Tax=Striga asiatica TaxID=4170 RepID=A0A5A7QFI9_STRAF|nr:nucleoporin interacting component family protein [Striga asiatica]
MKMMSPMCMSLSMQMPVRKEAFIFFKKKKKKKREEERENVKQEEKGRTMRNVKREGGERMKREEKRERDSNETPTLPNKATDNLNLVTATFDPGVEASLRLPASEFPPLSSNLTLLSKRLRVRNRQGELRSRATLPARLLL